MHFANCLNLFSQAVCKMPGIDLTAHTSDDALASYVGGLKSTGLFYCHWRIDNDNEKRKYSNQIIQTKKKNTKVFDNLVAARLTTANVYKHFALLH